MRCSYEKSKYGPFRTMPAFVWIVNSARSDGDSCIASAKRRSQSCSSRP